MAAKIEFRCPRCHYRCDAADAVTGERKPQPGDFAVCLHCAAPLEFGDDMAPRWLTAEEVLRLPNDERTELLNALVQIVTLRPALPERPTWELRQVPGSAA